MIGESIQFFEQKTRESVSETNDNYDIVIWYVVTHFFPPKALQRQKIYLRKGLNNYLNTKIRKFTCTIEEIVNELNKFPSFGTNQGFTKDEILKLV